MKPKHSATLVQQFGDLTALLVAVALYWVLIRALLGAEMSPFATQWSWQLAFEHGELQSEHAAHLLGIFLAACPVTVFLQYTRPRRAPALILLAALCAALPYALTPQAPYAEEQTWLLLHSVALEVGKLLLSPPLAWALSAAGIRVAHALRRHKSKR